MQKIPKIIHLCWLSGEPYPEVIGKCIKTWQKVMPDYQIILWNKERFDNEIKNTFARQALEKRKWAFVADYIRLYALYTYGGIYMDSDVRVYKRFDTFLEHSFFSCIEYFEPTNYVAIEAAIMGAEKENEFIKECLELYHNIPFIQPDGTLDQTPITVKIANIAAQNWGFKYIPQAQILRGDMHLYPPVTFTNPSGEFSTTQTYAIHLCNGSWVDKRNNFIERIIFFIKNYYNHPHIAIVNIYKKLKSKILR